MVLEKREILTKDGRKWILSSATSEFAESLIAHRTITSGETHFMAREPEECGNCYDLEKMRAYLADMAADEKNFLITVFEGDTIIGDAGITMINGHQKSRHRAYFGISIQQAYCECGLGHIMLQEAIRQAKENGFEQIELGVYADNERAIHVYEREGFQKYGCTPRAFKLKDGTYIDECIMVRML